MADISDQACSIVLKTGTGEEYLGGLGGASYITDAINLSGNSQSSFAISSTAAQSAALSAGIYDIWATVDSYIKVNEVANDVTTSTGYLLRANNTLSIRVGESQKIGCIISSGTSTLYLHKVS